MHCSGANPKVVFTFLLSSRSTEKGKKLREIEDFVILGGFCDSWRYFIAILFCIAGHDLSVHLSLGFIQSKPVSDFPSFFLLAAAAQQQLRFCRMKV